MTLKLAQHLFSGTGIQVTSDGRPYLGAALDSSSFIKEFTQQRISEWIAGVSRLSHFADTQPHASYSAFTHGMCPSGAIIFVLTQAFWTCFLHLSLPCITISWFSMLSVILNTGCFPFLCVLVV